MYYAMKGINSEALTAAGASEWIQEILESCPALKRITVRTVTARRMINEKPWACLGLEVLYVVINMKFQRE